MLHKTPRFCSAPHSQIQANIETLINLMRNLMHRFVDQFESSLVTALIYSASHFHSKNYAHYRDFFTLANGQQSVYLFIFFEDSLSQLVCLYIETGLVFCVFFMLLFYVFFHYVYLLSLAMDQINSV